MLSSTVAALRAVCRDAQLGGCSSGSGSAEGASVVAACGMVQLVPDGRAGDWRSREFQHRYSSPDSQVPAASMCSESVRAVFRLRGESAVEAVIVLLIDLIGGHRPFRLR